MSSSGWAVAARRRIPVGTSTPSLGEARVPRNGLSGAQLRPPTFHAVIFDHENRHAFALIDEPFARVPEGGPSRPGHAARPAGLVDAPLAVEDHLHPDPRGLRTQRAHPVDQPRRRRRHRELSSEAQFCLKPYFGVPESETRGGGLTGWRGCS
ncbi:hypothetical protein KUTG_08445 [Kutzneria sp. 744]|nr:hypothetical protein KUTG_08445 [Kutzneria sp. 744]